MSYSSAVAARANRDRQVAGAARQPQSIRKATTPRLSLVRSRRSKAMRRKKLLLSFVGGATHLVEFFRRLRSTAKRAVRSRFRLARITPARFARSTMRWSAGVIVRWEKRPFRSRSTEPRGMPARSMPGSITPAQSSRVPDMSSAGAVTQRERRFLRRGSRLPMGGDCYLGRERHQLRSPAGSQCGQRCRRSGLLGFRLLQRNYAATLGGRLGGHGHRGRGGV